MSPDAETWQAVTQLVQRANDAADATLLSDQALIDARSGKRDLYLVIDSSSAQPVGVEITGAGELDLIIDPHHRGFGFGGAALDYALTQSQGCLTTWVHGRNAAADSLLRSRGFLPKRTLLKMSRGLADASEVVGPKAELPRGLSLHTFTPGDSADWLKLNALVFKTHPEQGKITDADLAERLREPWFDSENFILLRDSAGQLVGFCWLKVTETEGEFYVIGVSPEAVGQGLGALLFDAGMRRLMSLVRDGASFRHISLFVEADNSAALQLYRSRGFTEVLTSSQWMFDRA